MGEEETKAEGTASDLEQTAAVVPEPAPLAASQTPPEAVPEVVKAEEPKVEKPSFAAESEAKEASEGGEKEKNEEEVGEKPLWYIIQTLTGYEERVKGRIVQVVAQENLTEKVFQILIPEEDVVEIRDGKRVEKKKKMFPGYVFIEMLLDDETWYAIRKTPGVAKFIGSGTRPIPVTDREMQRVLKQIGLKKEKIEVEFEIGEAIRVISGPFRGYSGTVQEVNEAKEKVRVLINIFGRDTPVEISFDHAEKLI